MIAKILANIQGIVGAVGALGIVVMGFVLRRKQQELEFSRIETAEAKGDCQNEKQQEAITSLESQVATDEKDRLEKEALANRLISNALDPDPRSRK